MSGPEETGQTSLHLAGEEATLTLGRKLAQALVETRVRCLLLYAPLGGGKTCLVRGLVQALPGAENAEVSSPSFTVCNIYPTQPPVLHVDLYRSEPGAPLPDELDEALDAGDHLCLVEWAERLPAAVLPGERLDIFLDLCQESRLARLVPHGPAARAAVRTIRLSCQSFLTA